MRKSILYRMLFYALGLLSLALGLTLNTKTGLGASAIISVAYSFSEIFEGNFGNVTLALYVVFVAAQMALHLMRAARYAKAEEGALAHAGRRDIKLVLLMDVLQIPLSIVFTRFLNVFSALIPALYTEGGAAAENFPVRMAALILAIIFTGIGAAMSLNMRVVPNPGDGIVQAIADMAGKGVGFTKNCFDLLNVTIAITLGMVFAGRLVGVGLGTIIAMFGVGRVIALFNHFAYRRMTELAGMEE